jgi:hypothetical protein
MNNLFSLFRKRRGKVIFLFVLTASIMFLLFIGWQLYVWSMNANKFLKLLSNINPDDIDKVEIKTESNNLFTINHDNLDLLESFLNTLKKTEIWHPEHPIGIKDILITIYMNDHEKYFLNCMITKEDPGVIFIYYTEGPTMNARYQNAELYNFLKKLNLL